MEDENEDDIKNTQINKIQTKLQCQVFNMLLFGNRELEVKEIVFEYCRNF